MPAQPALLGHYKVERTLGKGAMGVVYEGLDQRLHRRVAIKAIFKSEHTDLTQDYTVRFLREAQAVARLNHPNIVQVYDFGEDADVSFIVMELIHGEDLKTFFDDDKRLTLQEAVRITSELLDALDFAHGAGVIHRDIKPANIMVDRQGRTKLTDFGVARLLDVDRPGGDRTQAGTMVGTPAYMSPEQVLGQAVDHRADIFSAGVVLYQFLTGQKPFEGGAFTVAKKIVESDPRPPSSLVHSISPELDAIVARAMAKAPDQRFPRARDFAKALREALEHSPPPSDPEATFLNPDAPPARPKAPPPRAPERPARSSTSDTHPKLQASEADLMFWRSVKDSDDPDDLEFYVEKFPDGFYVDLARRKIAKLRRGSTVPSEEDTDSRARLMEEEFWRSVKDSSDADDIAFYVEKFPEGLYVELAKRKIAKLRRGGAAEDDSGSRGRMEDLARRQEEERAQFEAQERARRAAEEEVQRRAAEAKRLAEEEAKRQAVAKARREAEEEARRAAEERAKRELEERTRREAAERARREAEEKARREGEVAALREAEAMLIQQLSQEIRTMSYLLHPPLLDETGLSEALRWYIQGLAERSGLEIVLEIPERFERLPREMELVMFRLVQECLTNIHRHSESETAVIRIARDGENVSLEVQDKGKGISPERLSGIQARSSGVGIRGMRERVRHFGGKMNIESNDQGTKISFTLPLPKTGTASAEEIAPSGSTDRPMRIAG